MEKRYEVEKVWVHNSLICTVVFNYMGHRCGYVGIESDHPLYNQPYNRPSRFLQQFKNEVENSPIGKKGIIPLFCYDGRITPEIYFDVHGGITYSGGDEYPIEYPITKLEYRSCATLYHIPWWFGYDCAHVGDGKDTSYMDEDLKEIYERYPIDDPVRSLEYCIDECESLADQLTELVE